MNFIYKIVSFSLVLFSGLQENTEIISQSIGSITSNYSSGFYSEDVDLVFRTAEEGDLFYTLNGKLPKLGSDYTFQYRDTIFTQNLNSTSTYQSISALAKGQVHHYWEEGYELPVKGHSIKIARIKDSLIHEIAVFNYIIGPHDSLDIGYSIILNTDESGLVDQETGIFSVGDTTHGLVKGKENYCQKGKKWKRECNFQCYDSLGRLEYSSGADLSIFGFMSRFNPQKSLKLEAKGKYGNKKFKHSFFTDKPEKYKNLLLRSSFSGWNNGLNKDHFVSEACMSLDMENPKRKAVTVFINGEYWGIYFLSEKSDHNFLKNKTGIKKGKLNIVRDNGGGDWGSPTSYRMNQNFGFQNDLGIDSNYAKFSEGLDISSYLDWILAEVFFQNYDWPCNNTKLWNSESSLKWRNIFIDLDAAIDKNPNKNYFDRLYNFQRGNFKKLDNRCSFIFNNLLRNESFRIQLQSRLEELVKSVWSSKELFELYKKQHYILNKKYFMEFQRARWKYPNSGDFEKYESDLENWIKIRPTAVLVNLKQFLDKHQKDFVAEFHPSSFQFKIN